MIRYIAIILSVLTIALSALPCDDEQAVVVTGDTIVMNAASHSDNYDLGDLCSPFCTCACCANVVVESVFDQEIAATECIHAELNSIYLFSFSRDFSNPIFQPPQV